MTLAKHNHPESGALGKVYRLNLLNKGVQVSFNNQYEDEMVGWQHQLNVHEFEQTLGDNEGWGVLVAAVHGVTKSWTQLSDRKQWPIRKAASLRTGSLKALNVNRRALTLPRRWYIFRTDRDLGVLPLHKKLSLPGLDGNRIINHTKTMKKDKMHKNKGTGETWRIKKVSITRKTRIEFFLQGQLVSVEKGTRSKWHFSPEHPEKCSLVCIQLLPEAHSTSSKGNKMTKVPLGLLSSLSAESPYCPKHPLAPLGILMLYF